MFQVEPDFFPLADANPVRCGNRADLPKKQRRHTKAYLGMDTRNAGDKGFKDFHIFACVVCGMDEKRLTHKLPEGFFEQ